MESIKSALGYYYSLVTRESIDLSKIEQDEVLKHIQTGPSEEKPFYVDKLCKANLKLVFKIAKSYAYSEESLLNYISAGNEGLLKAIQNFKFGKAPFPNYAPHWIKQRIFQEIYQSTPIKVPLWRIKAFIRIKLMVSGYKATHDNLEPTLEQIAEDTKLSIKNVEDLREDPYLTKVLDRAVSDEECPILSIFDEDSIKSTKLHTSSEKVINEFVLTDLLSSAMEYLKVEHRYVLKAYYGLITGEPQTLSEIALVLGRTQERVRQIRNEALSILKKLLKDSSISSSDFEMRLEN